MTRVSVIVAIGLLSVLIPLSGIAQDWVIRSVHVLDIHTGKFSKPRDVLVKDGTIEKIAADIRTDGEKEILGKDKYLVPGFTEMHAHIPPAQLSDAERDRLMFLYSAYGITTVRGMLGHPLHLALRDQLADNLIHGPRLITSGPSFNGRSVFSVSGAAGMVEAQVKKGYDFIKVHPGLSHQEFNAMAKKAKALNQPFAGHATAASGLMHVAQSGQGTIDHLDGVMQELSIRSGNKVPENVGFFGSELVDNVDPEQIKPLAQELAKTGIAMVPTESLMYGFVSPESPQLSAQTDAVKLMPEDTVKRWVATRTAVHEGEGYTVEKAIRFLDYRRQFVRAFVEAGGLVLLGSDAPQVFNVPGDALHFEMQLMVGSGMTPAEVLQAASIKPAVYFGRDKEFGSLDVGKAADMVLLSANPLLDIKNTREIDGVMTRGMWLPGSQIESRLNELRR